MDKDKAPESEGSDTVHMWILVMWVFHNFVNNASVAILRYAL